MRRGFPVFCGCSERVTLPVGTSSAGRSAGASGSSCHVAVSMREPVALSAEDLGTRRQQGNVSDMLTAGEATVDPVQLGPCASEEDGATVGHEAPPPIGGGAWTANSERS